MEYDKSILSFLERGFREDNHIVQSCDNGADGEYLALENSYDVDSSRAKAIKGFGLGLSIVQNSIKLHNGKLNISSKEGIGTTVEVIL